MLDALCALLRTHLTERIAGLKFLQDLLHLMTERKSPHKVNDLWGDRFFLLYKSIGTFRIATNPLLSYS